MPTHRYIALLRGINVGGKNIIKMQALRECFEDMSCTEVQTYIQSGNVLFASSEKDISALTDAIEKRLTKEFSYTSRVVLLSAKQLQEAAAQAPKGFGSKPDTFRYDVIFVKPPLTTTAALKEISVKEGVDTVHAGTHALYFSRLISKATQSHLSKIIALPLYKSTTIRNWNTTTKLLELMNGQQ